MSLHNTTYAVGVFACGSAVLFHDGPPFCALCAQNGGQKKAQYYAAAGEKAWTRGTA